MDPPKRKSYFSILAKWLLFTVISLLAACLYPLQPGGRDGVLLVLFVGLLLSISSLVGMGLGISNHRWRFFAAPFAILIPATILGTSSAVRFEWIEASISAATSITIFATLEAIKFFFGNFRIPIGKERTSDGLQFGITQLMVITASVAITLVSIKYILLGSTVTYRLLISVLVVLTAIAPATFLAQNESMFKAWLWLFAICWGITTLQVWLLRHTGLRFVRK